MYVAQAMQSNRPLPLLENTRLRLTNEIREYNGRNLIYLLSCLFYILASPFASIFKFGVFNIIQSKCIDDVISLYIDILLLTMLISIV